MNVEHLPWDSLEGPIYSARELKPRKKWVTNGCWVLSCFLIIGGIITPYRMVTIFGVLYILTLLMKKDTVITERGVEIFYQMRITTHYDLWSWSEIISIVREDRNHPELVALHFGRGNRSKRLFFTKADAKQIIVLAKKKNSRIVVADADQRQRVGSKRK